jgi:outer membrane immunogenic protein
MKRVVLLTALMGISSAGVASAADLNLLAPTIISNYSTGFSWTGFYAGVNAGYGWGYNTVTPAIPFLTDSRGAIGGVQAGYNYDLGGFVLGAEAEFDFAGIEYVQGVAPLTTTFRVENLGTVRARAGVAADRFLPYIAGGIAFGSAIIDGAGTVVRQTHVGWTAGVGVEYAVTDNVTVRAEYAYTDLGARTYVFAPPVGAAENRPTFSTVKAGINFKF